MQGKIIKGIAGFYYIYAENDEIYECKAKGIFRKDKKNQNVEEKSTLRNVTERNVYRCKHFIANQPKTTSE